MAAERKTRDEVLRLIRAGRGELEAALARTPDERIEEPLLDGGWSAKDLMAHVAHWEMAFLSNLGEPTPPVADQGGEDATNRAVYEYHRTRPLLDIRREFEETHRRLLERVSQLDDDGLNARPVPDNDTVVWQYVAGETWITTRRTSPSSSGPSRARKRAHSAEVGYSGRIGKTNTVDTLRRHPVRPNDG